MKLVSHIKYNKVKYEIYYEVQKNRGLLFIKVDDMMYPLQITLQPEFYHGFGEENFKLSTFIQEDIIVELKGILRRIRK